MVIRYFPEQEKIIAQAVILILRIKSSHRHLGTKLDSLGNNAYLVLLPWF
jgi:hypothetical protein